MVSLRYPVGEFLQLIEQYLVEGLLPTVALNKALNELGKDYGLIVKEVAVSGWPLYSVTASGKYLDKVFVTRAGDTYIRKYVIPRDPKTEKQLAHRNKWKQVVESWKNLSEVEKYNWNVIAHNSGRPISGFNLYMEHQFQKS